ncbi:MAG: ATPase, T2SS/T4P/T4SS family [Bacillota bacterium]
MNPHLSLITIENPAELQLQHPHVRRWEARPANIEGAGEFTMMSLLITALRSRPDIIIVGEVRGKEAYVLMQALNTGHMGSMTTMHANSSAEAMKRLIAMVTSAGELAPALVPEYIAEGVDLVVQLMRFSDGKRRPVAGGTRLIDAPDGYRGEHRVGPAVLEAYVPALIAAA